MMTTLLFASIALALAVLFVATSSSVVWALKTGGRRDDVADHYGAPSQSRFTIPVSIIVPGGCDATQLDRCLAAVLALNYPELEVIVVDDSQRVLLGTSVESWRLTAKEYFYRQSIPTAAVHRIYSSARDARVTFVDKGAASYCDAVNCGVNIARYRYVAVVGPEVECDPNALLRLMAAALRDPGTVVGASSHVKRLGVSGRLESARALMASRLWWRRLACGVAPRSHVSVWRRDAVLDAEGFSEVTADADLNLAVRALVTGRKAGMAARFHRGSDLFGTIPAHSNRRGGVQTNMGRWRTSLQLDTFRGFGFWPGLALLAGEVLLPLAQLWVLSGTALAAALGLLPWTGLLLAVVLLSFGRAAVTTAALLMHGAAQDASDEAELSRLILLAPFEMLMRPFNTSSSFGIRA